MATLRQACWSIAGLAVLGVAWACQDAMQQPIAPSRMTIGKAAYDASSPPPVVPGALQICKDTPTGMTGIFTFDVTTTANGSSTQSYNIKSGHCLTFGIVDGVGQYSVIENLSQTPGWTLVSVTVTTESGSQELSGNGIGSSANPVVCSSSAITGCNLIFHNIPSTTPPPETPCPAGSFSFHMNAAGDLEIVYDQFPAPNDNSYGVNAVGWGSKGHTFGNLTGSDHAGFQLRDPSGVVRLSFNVDYLSAVAGPPSGFASLGVTGGDGKMIVGTAAGITATTSLANNLNNINIPGLFVGGVQQFGSVNVLVNSPPTDAAHQTYANSDPALAGWDFHNTYFVTISAAKLAGLGFNPATWSVEPNPDQLHNSPAKPCPPSSGGACALAITKTETKDRQLKITISNTGSTDVFLSEVDVTWPEAINGLLKKVKIDGDVVYDNPDIAGGSATLNTQLTADMNKRKIAHGQSDVLILEFQNNVDTDLLHYTLTAKFGDCVVTIGGP